MAARCRACKALAQGTELAVLNGRGKWRAWHLCGRCWGLLILGLRMHPRAADLDPSSMLRGLELRPREVHTLIAEGLGVIGQHGGMPEGKRLELIEQEQFLLVELRELVHEVEASARDHEPAEAWRGLRREIARLRERVKDLRDRYPRPRLPSG